MTDNYVSDDEGLESDDEVTGEGMSEEDQQSIAKAKHSIKRSRHNTQDESEEPKKKTKKLGKELFRPPTAEEMNQLRETENLFSSNLFRLQIEEMMTEITVKPKFKSQFDKWIEEFKEYLHGMKSTKEFQLSDLSFIRKLKLNLPIEIDVSKFKGTFQFVKPSEVTVVGSYTADCRLGPNIEVDIKVEMPQECLLRTDYQNQRYFLKRALYISVLASRLKTWSEVTSIEFSQLEGDPLKPVLCLVPSGKLGKQAVVRVLVVPPQDYFKLSQVVPARANVKSKWMFGSENVDGVNPPTPRYNRSVAVDLTMTTNEQARLQALDGQQPIREGIMLLKVWLRQRGLDQGYGAFSGYIMSMYVIYLLKHRRLSSVMSSYQIVRNTWNCLALADWTTEGISLSQNAEGSLPITDFHLLHDVVFVDTSGFVNLCGNMCKSTFFKVKAESALAVKSLDNPNINSFQVLFMTPMLFYRQYDHLISFHDLEELQKTEDRVGEPSYKLDCAGPWLARDAIVSLLQQGLGHRVSLMTVQLHPLPTWPLDKEPPNPRDIPLVLGLMLNPDHAFSIVDKGPAANLPEAKEFRDFWGEKSELRRFRDGTICEAVVWSGDGVDARRLVCRQVVHHIAQQHLGMAPASLLYVADQLAVVLTASAGEEGALAATKACDELNRQLMQLEGLPLSISNIQGSAACLRYADPFPPIPLKTPKLKNESQPIYMKATGSKNTKFVPPIPVVLTLSSSSKWPDDLEAIRRIKAAFYIKIAQCLSEQCKLIAQPYAEFVDVFKNGYVFRLSVSQDHEVSLLKKNITPQGQIQYKDTEESLALKMKMSHLPKLTAMLHGLHLLHAALGPASCLAKRWVAAHMLLDDSLMPEICVELLVASLFLAPEPYQAPLQPQPAFLRFLQRLANNPWSTEPLIVNFSGEILRQDLVEIENKFNSERSSLPPLFIATPDCRSGTTWTRTAPSIQVLLYLAQLAKASLSTLDSQLLSPTMDHKMIFRTPKNVFDVIIRLQKHLTRKEEAVDGWEIEAPELPDPSETMHRIPVVDLDLAQCFLRQLRDAYDDFALFLYDKHGGREIGVIYKPHVLKPREFRVSHINAQNPIPPNKMGFNLEAFLDDIRLMGDGLVKSVRIKGEE